MNHSNAFHALRRQLVSEVAALQRKGYYGDGTRFFFTRIFVKKRHHLSRVMYGVTSTGYWSAGTRLSDSQPVFGPGVGAQELPEYTVRP